MKKVEERIKIVGYLTPYKECVKCNKAFNRYIIWIDGEYHPANVCKECMIEEINKIKGISVIRIEGEVKEYLDEILYGDGAEAYYTGGIELDLTDYNGAIKVMANYIEFQRVLLNERLDYNPPFKEGIKIKEIKDKRNS
jgi:hypothetical protein